MKTKKTKAEYLKRARRGMLGFIITWQDKDPFGDNIEITGGEIDHENPIQRLICVDMWKRCSQWIVNSEFTWHVIMRVIFEGAPKGDCFVDCEFTVTGTLRGKNSDPLNDAMERAFKEVLEGNAICRMRCIL